MILFEYPTVCSGSAHTRPRGVYLQATARVVVLDRGNPGSTARFMDCDGGHVPRSVRVRTPLGKFACRPSLVLAVRTAIDENRTYLDRFQHSRQSAACAQAQTQFLLNSEHNPGRQPPYFDAPAEYGREWPVAHRGPPHQQSMGGRWPNVLTNTMTAQARSRHTEGSGPPY